MFFQDWDIMKKHFDWGSNLYLLPLLASLKPSDIAFCCVSGECSSVQGTTPMGASPGFVSLGIGEWHCAICYGQQLVCTLGGLSAVLVISGILLVAVQNPGSSVSLRRLRWCWSRTSFCLILILVASAISTGWKKLLMWSCDGWTLPVVLN